MISSRSTLSFLLLVSAYQASAMQLTGNQEIVAASPETNDTESSFKTVLTPQTKKKLRFETKKAITSQDLTSIQDLIAKYTVLKNTVAQENQGVIDECLARLTKQLAQLSSLESQVSVEVAPAAIAPIAQTQAPAATSSSSYCIIM